MKIYKREYRIVKRIGYFEWYDVEHRAVWFGVPLRWADTRLPISETIEEAVAKAESHSVDFVEKNLGVLPK